MIGERGQPLPEERSRAAAASPAQRGGGGALADAVRLRSKPSRARLARGRVSARCPPLSPPALGGLPFLIDEALRRVALQREQPAVRAPRLSLPLSARRFCYFRSS